MRTVQLKLTTLVAAALIIFAGGGFVAYEGQLHGWHFGKTDTSKIDFSQLQTIYEVLQRKFDGQLDPAKLLDGAKLGLTAATGDPYTTYLNEKSAKQLDDDLSGTLSGIGAEIGIRSSTLSVIAPIDGSPAAKAGLKSKDFIVKINGEDSAGLTLEEAVSKIRGDKGTQVKLTIVRGNQAPFELTITRDVISVASVKWSQPKPGIGLIKISRFGSDTSDLVEQAGRELKQQGAKKIILDLRDDPGGYLDAAVKISGQFLNSGELVVEERHGDKSIEKLNAPAGGQSVGVPMVVLINGGSASASEIVAGALQDHRVATVVGEKSYGKGSVQEVQKLYGGAALKVTIAHWYTPNGKNIGKEGIKPDVEVKMETADFDAGRDPQMDKALELIAAK